MCDACQAKGVNWSLSNGPGRSHLERAKLYSAFEGREVNIKLCYLCSLNLFMGGERKFLTDNKQLNVELKQQYGGNDFDF